MSSRQLLIATLAASLLRVGTAWAEEVRYFEQNGVTYRETRRMIEEQVPETRIEQRSQTVYRAQQTTETRQTTRVCLAPITEYTWEAYWIDRWNPFVQPQLAYRCVPQTRWQQRTETVQLPVTVCQMVPETRTVDCPVTTYRTVQKELVTRVAVSGRGVSPAGSQPSVGSQPSMIARRSDFGGIRRLDQDPPRYGSGTAWHSAATMR